MRPGTVLKAAFLAALVTVAVAVPAQAALTLVPAYLDSAANPVAMPIYVTAPPGDEHRLFVVERDGRIRVAVDGVMQDAPFLDISDKVETEGEGGLLSVAFAPDYAASGKFYVYYVEHPDGAGIKGDIRIDEFIRSADPNVASTTARPILEIQHDSTAYHYGGTIAFDKSGDLYAAPGDGATGGAPAQDPASMLGKLLKVDTGTTPGATVVASGLRNPFRFSFDRATGDIVIGDVGEKTREEIDWLKAGTFDGVNFGWPTCEGSFLQGNSSQPCTFGTLPIFDYPRTMGHSVTGGVVVRDSALTPLLGRYVYADHFTGDIRSLALAAPATGDRSEGLPVVPRIVAFGEDAAAHVYVVSLYNAGTSKYGGKVWRIACDGNCDAPGGDGSGGSPQTPGDPAPGDPPAGDPGPGDPPADQGQQPAPPVRDTRAPRVRVRAARTQRVPKTHRVRLAVACNEPCAARISARTTGTGRKSLALRGTLKRIGAGQRLVVELRPSKRALRALAKRGSITIAIRARDAAGNAASARLAIRIKR